MTGIKPSTHGIVVDHLESGVRYAVSDKNYNEKVHRKVRDLRPGETVLGYQPRRKEALSASPTPTPTPSAVGTQKDRPADASEDTQAEGATEVATKGK